MKIGYIRFFTFYYILDHLGTNAAVLIIVLMLDFPKDVAAGL